MDAQSDHASILHQTALDNPAQQRHVDIAAAHQHRRPSALCKARPLLQQRRQSGRARSFGQRLLALQQRQNRTRNLILVDRNNLVDILGNDRKGDLARASDSNAIGNRRRRLQRHGMMRLNRIPHRRQPRRLHANHAHARLYLLHRTRNTTNQPASANRHHHRLQIFHLLQ